MPLLLSMCVRAPMINSYVTSVNPDHIKIIKFPIKKKVVSIRLWAPYEK